MAGELITGVSQRQLLFDKREANYKSADLKDNIWQSVCDQLG